MVEGYRASVDSVVFIGDYLPRKCGIATFTTDLQHAVEGRFPAVDCSVVAVNDPLQTYDYSDLVRFEVEEQDLDTYERAADFLDLSGSDVICVQHEFGIYGGTAGRYLLEAIRRVEAPIVTTLHTILEHPTAEQNSVLREVAALSARLVVMSARAETLLASVYDVPHEKIDLIPHGIPDLPFVDSSFYKDKIGVEGKFVLLTFGLLSRNKGIEHVIEALPRVLQAYPNVVYIVLGATHPHVVKSEGEAYRHSLEKRVRDLGIEQAVMFVDRFVEIEELKEFIAAADMYVTPYLNPDQITSGTLAYSFGCGKAVISTPYLHAAELLADDRGILVPFGDDDAIALAALDLLGDESRRHAMRKKAYLLGREMIWSEVAARYMESFEKARRCRSGSCPSPAGRLDDRAAASDRRLPDALSLDHMRCLTDSTGILQHARFALPHTPEGYCTDDNARALDLTVTIESMRLSPIQPRVSDLITTYAAFVNAAFVSDTALFRNFMGYDRRWLDDRGTDDCQGRALSALATCIAKSRDENLRRWAAGMFLKALPTILDARSPRAWAHAMIGIGEYSQSLPGATGARHIGDTLRERLLTCFAAAKSESWPWFEASLAYDNAILSHALIVRGRNDPESLEVGLRSLEWLMQLQTAPEGHFRPIGCNGFYSRNGERARFDQQPIEAAGMVSACLAAFRVTGNSAWVECARVAFAWFHGGNDLGIPVVDRLTGGCRDGLCVDRLNMNQGAESTLAYLSARVQMEGHLGAGERIDRQAGNSVSPNGIGGPAEDNPVAAVTVAVTRRHTANASRALAL